MKLLYPILACIIFSALFSIPIRAQGPAIHVTLLGTRGLEDTTDGPFPAEAGVLVEAGGETLLFDCGRGIPERLSQLEFSKSGSRLGVSKIFLTSLVADHVEGLPVLWMLGWPRRQNTPLAVWGPGPDGNTSAGTTSLTANLQVAYDTNTHIRRDLIGPVGLPSGGSQIQTTEIGEGVVYQNNGVIVTAFAVNHGPVKPAFGYRVDYAGHSVVYSGDTTLSANLINFAKGADVLIHEVYVTPTGAPSGGFQDPFAAYHTTPEQAAQVFNQTTPGLAVYTHIVKATASSSPSQIRDRTRAAGYTGPLEIGQDLMSIDVSDSTAVRWPSTCPEPDISAVTDSNSGRNIASNGSIIVSGNGFTASGGNSIQLIRDGYDTVTLDENDGLDFSDQSSNQVSAALGGRVTPGDWDVVVRNICGTPTRQFQITIH
jgi:ribonuclease Z